MNKAFTKQISLLVVGAMILSGLGLVGIRERVTILGGELYISSQPGGGTHLIIEVPLD